MNYFSTKQLSEKWEISPKRITQLCQQGRIEGAVLRDRRWLIPENAAKPEDTRKRDSKTDSEKFRYIYPQIICVARSPAQVENDFSEEERALFGLYLLYENAEFTECLGRSREMLQKTENPYIRLGLLFLITDCCLYLNDFYAVTVCSAAFTSELSKVKLHREELDILELMFRVEVEAPIVMVERFGFDPSTPFSDSFLPVLEVCSACRDAIAIYAENSVPNIYPHEILCRKMELDGPFFCAMMVHIYLYGMCSALPDPERERFHIKRALDTAIEHNTVFTFSLVMCYLPDRLLELLNDYPSEIREKLLRFADIGRTTFSKYADFRSKKGLSLELSELEYTLISYCLRDYSVQQISELLEFSPSKTKKHLTALYAKLGVSSKKELYEIYLGTILK